MKRLYSILIVLAIAVFCNAQHTLNVVLKGGDYVSYDFAEKPKATIGKSTINLTTTKVQIVFNMNEVQRFSIDDAPETLTRVESVKVTTSQDGPVQIYNIDGLLVRSGADSTASYSNLPKGIYIVKKGKVSHKLILK